MKKKIFAIILTLSALVGIPLITAAPAMADQTASFNCWGYNYTATVDFNRPSPGSVLFNYWYISGASPMEYRVRWFAPNHSNVIYDSGYANGVTSPQQAFPGVSRYLNGSTSYVLVNAGKAFDGHASCEYWFNIPG